VGAISRKLAMRLYH